MIFVCIILIKCKCYKILFTPLLRCILEYCTIRRIQMSTSESSSSSKGSSPLPSRSASPLSDVSSFIHNPLLPTTSVLLKANDFQPSLAVLLFDKHVETGYLGVVVEDQSTEEPSPEVWSLQEHPTTTYHLSTNFNPSLSSVRLTLVDRPVFPYTDNMHSRRLTSRPQSSMPPSSTRSRLRVFAQSYPLPSATSKPSMFSNAHPSSLDLFPLRKGFHQTP